MSFLSSIFDVVRIVDPYCTSVMNAKDAPISYGEEECFSIWEKDKRCKNCISLRACADRTRRSKFEFKNDEAFSVVSMPLSITSNGKEHVIALELANRVSDDMQVHVSGSDIIAHAMKEYDQKLYEDVLTGIYNRRYLEEKIFLFDMGDVMSKRVGFIVLDIRKFKLINDVYGHIKGDEVLCRVARTLKENIRNTDHLIRIGGDEFLVIMRDCADQDVGEAIKRLKAVTSSIRFTDAEELTIVINAGYSYTDVFDGGTEQIRGLLDSADGCMYKDKI